MRYGVTGSVAAHRRCSDGLAVRLIHDHRDGVTTRLVAGSVRKRHTEVAALVHRERLAALTNDGPGTGARRSDAGSTWSQLAGERHRLGVVDQNVVHSGTFCTRCRVLRGDLALQVQLLLELELQFGGNRLLSLGASLSVSLSAFLANGHGTVGVGLPNRYRLGLDQLVDLDGLAVGVADDAVLPELTGEGELALHPNRREDGEDDTSERLYHQYNRLIRSVLRNVEVPEVPATGTVGTVGELDAHHHGLPQVRHEADSLPQLAVGCADGVDEGAEDHVTIATGVTAFGALLRLQEGNVLPARLHLVEVPLRLLDPLLELLHLGLVLLEELLLLLELGQLHLGSVELLVVGLDLRSEDSL